MFARRVPGIFKWSLTRPPVRNAATGAVHQGLFDLSNDKGSPLVRDLISNNKHSKRCYENYLRAYQQGKNLFQKEEYVLAKEKCNEAFSQLVEVNTITAALGDDFIKMRSLLNLVEKGMSEIDKRPTSENKNKQRI